MRVRTYEIGDTQEIVQLFYDTIHEVNIRDYTQAQVDATEASITAKPFFESQGFLVVKQQEVERRGQKLINFAMEKFI